MVPSLEVGKMNRLGAIKDFSEQCLFNRRTKPGEIEGWRYKHSIEVFECALEIIEHRKTKDHNLDLEIIEASCLLHDIEKGLDTGLEDHHAERGAEKSKALLMSLFEVHRAEKILEMIRCHDQRKVDGTSYDEYVMLIQDADILSKFSYDYIWNKNYESGRHLCLENLRGYHEKLIDVKARISCKLNFDESVQLLEQKVNQVIIQVDEMDL